MFWAFTDLKRAEPVIQHSGRLLPKLNNTLKGAVVQAIVILAPAELGLSAPVALIAISLSELQTVNTSTANILHAILSNV
jgi:hypothetical protein